MSAAIQQKPKAAAPNDTLLRVRALLTPLNLHWAGVVVLSLLILYFFAQMAFVWQSASDHNTAAIDNQRLALRTAEIAALPLRGLDAKLTRATDEANQFSRQRLPEDDSEVAAELGTLTKQHAVRLTRAQYMHDPVLIGSAGELTEVRIDATLSGDYRPLMEVINALERDKMFFVIQGITLNGQQSGTVNLRLRMKTYERRITSEDTPATTQISVSGSSSVGGER